MNNLKVAYKESKEKKSDSSALAKILVDKWTRRDKEAAEKKYSKRKAK